MASFEQNVSFQGATLQLNGFLAHPEGAGAFPTVVVIHEAYGLNDNIRDVTRKFVSEGYLAFAVDLFSGRNPMLCMARFFGGILFNSLDHEGIKNLRAALDHLATLPEVDKNRLGAIGFCLGGSFAIAWACADNRLKAIAPYYGFNPRPLEAVKRSCPVVGSYPGSDITAGQGNKLNLELEIYHVPHDIKIYPGAHHSFFNDRGGRYDAAASADSWQRVMSFFEEHLG
ncbi:MAG TPA: dienelactone hydrolase family protein [Aggregatilineales bacterium]|nr:dienelactone hydrolase family protein [Aggregatilineales bacterium]